YAWSPTVTSGIATLRMGGSPPTNGVKARKMSPTSSGGRPLIAGSKHRIRLKRSPGFSRNSRDSQQEHVERISTCLEAAKSATERPFRYNAPMSDVGVGM